MRCHSNVSWHTAVQGAVAALVFAASSASPAADLGLAGDKETLWLYRTHLEPPGEVQLLRFAFANLNDAPVRFRPLDQSEIGGEAERTGVRRGQLHVFFEDGTHQRYAPVALGTAPPRQSTFWELKLPESCVPLAVAGDSAADVLYAVVPGRVAERVDTGPAPQSLPDTAGAAATQPVDQPQRGLEIRATTDAPLPESQPNTTQPVMSQYCLVRYERGTWVRDREIPEFFDDHAQCRLTASEGVCDLYFTHGGDDSALYWSRMKGGEWSDPKLITPARREQVPAYGVTDGRPALIVNRGDRLAVLVRQEDGWNEQLGIGDPAQGGWGASVEVPVACMAGQMVAVAWRHDDGRINAGVWELSGGVIAEPAVIEALDARPLAPINRKALELLPFVVLTLTMLFIFTRRRQSVVADANLHDDQALSSYGTRLLAFLLDVLITAPATAPIMSGWLRHVEGNFAANFQTASVVHFPELFQRWMIALAIYIAYCIVFEGLRAATPGKMITGCRVVAENGERCSFGAIVARNVCRCVELLTPSFAPILILVFLTRNRQRLGDLVARSVVVQYRGAGSAHQDGESAE